LRKWSYTRGTTKTNIDMKHGHFDTIKYIEGLEHKKNRPCSHKAFEIDFHTRTTESSSKNTLFINNQA